jgi:hypothetical protein
MFLHHAQIQKIGKTSSLKVFWSKETKEMKQDSQKTYYFSRYRADNDLLTYYISRYRTDNDLLTCYVSTYRTNNDLLTYYVLRYLGIHPPVKLPSFSM